MHSDYITLHSNFMYIFTREIAIRHPLKSSFSSKKKVILYLKELYNIYGLLFEMQCAEITLYK